MGNLVIGQVIGILAEQTAGIFFLDFFQNSVIIGQIGTVFQ
jgi:hypothetical protein